MEQQFKHPSITGAVPHSTDHMVGTSVELWSARQDFALGHEQNGRNGAVLRYVKAGADLAAGTCAVSALNVAGTGTGYKVIRPAKADQFGFVVKERA
jgi:hypothetical protein